MVKETKLYDQLNISPSATQDEIKKAYRYVYRARLFLLCLLAGSYPRCGRDVKHLLLPASPVNHHHPIITTTPTQLTR
jgi:hypothetical protein